MKQESLELWVVGHTATYRKGRPMTRCSCGALIWTFTEKQAVQRILAHFDKFAPPPRRPKP